MRKAPMKGLGTRLRRAILPVPTVDENKVAALGLSLDASHTDQLKCSDRLTHMGAILSCYPSPVTS